MNRPPQDVTPIGGSWPEPTGTLAAPGLLTVDERSLLRAARLHGPRGSLVSICWRQWYIERILRWRRRVNFRSPQNDQARTAYCAIRQEEFAAVNARQNWANWRTIPRNLNQRLSARPVFAIDLCCGIGDSTAVLAYYCAAGSRILGLEFNPEFVATAQTRQYVTREGGAARVSFHAQSVLERFCDETGASLPDHGADLVNACGAVGLHFNREATLSLAAECARVLCLGGLATIDCGRPGTSAEELMDTFGRHGFRHIHTARSCVFDRYRQLCLRLEGP